MRSLRTKGSPIRLMQRQLCLHCASISGFAKKWNVPSFLPDRKNSLPKSCGIEEAALLQMRPFSSVFSLSLCKHLKMLIWLSCFKGGLNSCGCLFQWHSALCKARANQILCACHNDPGRYCIKEDSFPYMILTRCEKCLWKYHAVIGKCLSHSLPCLGWPENGACRSASM